jgi:hypothetical protein
MFIQYWPVKKSEVAIVLFNYSKNCHRKQRINKKTMIDKQVLLFKSRVIQGQLVLLQNFGHGDPFVHRKIHIFISADFQPPSLLKLSRLIPCSTA